MYIYRRMLTDERILCERVPEALELLRQSWPAHESPFSWRMMSRRLDYPFQNLCLARRGTRTLPKRVLVEMIDLALDIGKGREVVTILKEGSGSDRYSQSSQPSGPLSPAAWAQRPRRTTSRY